MLALDLVFPFWSVTSLLFTDADNVAVSLFGIDKVSCADIGSKRLQYTFYVGGGDG